MDRETQLIAFLRDAPGELSKLCDVLRAHEINILAMSIQNAEDYLRGLFKARELTGRRIAPAANYGSIMKDSEDYSVIRFVVEHHQTEDAVRILREARYTIETTPVLMIVLENRPGMLGAMAGTFARAGINIDYVYGSALSGFERSLFVVHVKEKDVEKAAALFPMDEA
jgi:hypothetical protein